MKSVSAAARRRMPARLVKLAVLSAAVKAFRELEMEALFIMFCVRQMLFSCRFVPVNSLDFLKNHFLRENQRVLPLFLMQKRA